VSLLAGALQVMPPKCQPITDLSPQKYREIGCHTAAWQAKTLANPYDLLVQGGLHGA
jgi:hypothetical protein